MSTFCRYIALLVAPLLTYSYVTAHDHPPSQPFRENLGQWEDHIKFRADLPDGFLWLENNRFTYSFYDGKPLHDLHAKNMPEGFVQPEYIKAHAFQVNFVASNPNPEMESEIRSEDYMNYFLGNDQSKWATRAYAWNLVRYKELYDHTDLNIYRQMGELKYDYVVRPGGDPKEIRMYYDGVDDMEVKHGNLYIKTSVNEVIENRPYAYQVINGKRKNVPCSFELTGHTISFKFPLGYNKKHELIIDPILIFGSYTGSPLNNFGFTATYDFSGNLYGGGIVFTGTGNYPTSTGAYQIAHAGGIIDIGITKFSDDGTSLIYSTLIGGTANESPHSLVVNSNDELIIFGTTGSSDFPMLPSSYDGSFAGGTAIPIAAMTGYGYDHASGTDMILAKLSFDGTALLGATFIGGTGNDGLILVDSLDYNYGDTFRGEVIVDDNDNIYVASTTASIDFPLANPIQPLYGGGARDAALFKFNPTLTTMLFSTYIGGNSDDAGYGVQASSTGDMYICGGTKSDNLPIPAGGANPNYMGHVDGFIVQVDANGTNVIAGTYVGTADHDQTYFVQLDNNDNVYVVGQCRGNYPVGTTLSTPLYSAPGSKQFLHKFNNTLSATIWSTVIGSGQDKVDFSLSAFLVNQCDHIYISGWGGNTNMTNRGFFMPNASSTTGLPTLAASGAPPYQSTTTGSDFYLMVLREEAEQIIYATFYGGSSSSEHVDGGTSRFDKSGKVYQAVCAGCGGFDDFPTQPGVVSQTNGSSCNLGVFKFDLAELTSNVAIGLPYICIPGTMTFTNLSNGGTDFEWDFGDGNTSTDFSPTHTFTDTGTFTVTLVVSDSLSCVLTDTAYVTIQAFAPNNAGIQPVDTICAGDSIQLFASGGITYQWIPTTGLSDPTISNPWASPATTTDYMLLTTDSCGTDTAHITILLHNEISSTSPNANICIGGSAPIWAQGGVSYSWTPAGSLSDPLSSNPTASPTQTTMYVVEITTVNGCVIMDSVLVTVDITPPNPTLSPDTTICQGDAVQLFANGANSYSWFPPAGLNSSIVSNPIASPEATVTYVVDYINGCGVVQDSVTVTVIEAEASAISDQWVCPGDSVLLWAAGGVSYIWTPNETLSNPDSSHTWATPTEDITYDVLLANNFGCIDSTQVSVFLYPVPYVSAGDDHYILWGSTAQLDADGWGTFVWDYDTTLSCLNCESPIASPLQTTTYYVTVTDANGCTNRAAVTVFVDGSLYVPNTFTPNGDGKNDQFFALGEEIKTFHLMIFNRWGELIFESNDITQSWDGTYLQEPVQIDTYVWKIEYEENSGKEATIYGHVNLVR